MPTQQTYRRTLAPLLGMHERFTATAGANNTTSQLESTTGSQTGLRFLSSINSTSIFDDKWIHRPAAAAAGDIDRRLATYTRASGLMTPDNVWTNAPTSEAFEMNGLVSGSEMLEWLNEGLKMCWVTREFTFTVTSSNIRQHNLASGQTWLLDWRWVYQLGHLNSGESRIGTATVAQTDPFTRWQTGKAYNLPGQVWIEGPSWQSTATVYVKAVCPAYNLCRAAAGTFGDRNGLAAETHEAPVDEYWLAWAAILAGGQRIDTLLANGQGNDDARKNRAIAAARFSVLTNRYFQQPERTFFPLEWIGPTDTDSWDAIPTPGVA